MKLDTVKDALDMISKCVELSSRLNQILVDSKGLLPKAQDALKESSALMDFLADELIPGLKING